MDLLILPTSVPWDTAWDARGLGMQVSVMHGHVELVFVFTSHGPQAPMTWRHEPLWKELFRICIFMFTTGLNTVV